MSDPAEWSEETALDRWLEDLEQEDLLRDLVAGRLASPPVDASDVREASFRAAAERWMERGCPQVAAGLLNRSFRGPEVSPVRPKAGKTNVHGLGSVLDLFVAGRPGSAGLPALTEEELAQLRETTDPDEAMLVLEVAKKRLSAHGQEARRLLRAWLARQDEG